MSTGPTEDIDPDATTPETPPQKEDPTPMPATDDTNDPAKPEPVTGQMSDKPLLDNTWGQFEPDAPIDYHTGGSIGTAINQMGSDARMDVAGEPLANVLGKVATDVVTGRRTAQEGIDQYKAIRDRLPEDSQARQALTTALYRMDAPATPAPTLPDNTPQPLRQLAADLHAVPIARADPRELDDLTRIANDAAAGKIRGLRLADAVRELVNQRHESDGDAGKFEIERAVQRAVDELRKPRTT